MSGTEYILLGLRILDEQLVDSSGKRCGRVEDLEFDGGPGTEAQLIGFLCGATAWKRRLTPSMADMLPGDPSGLDRVEWEHVAAIGNEIELDLAEEEREHAQEDEGAPMAMSDLLGTLVIDDRERKIGRIREVVASRARDQDDAPWRIHSLLVGRRAMFQRIGFFTTLCEEMEREEFPSNLIRWEWATGFEEDEEGRRRLRLGQRHYPRGRTAGSSSSLGG